MFHRLVGGDEEQKRHKAAEAPENGLLSQIKAISKKKAAKRL